MRCWREAGERKRLRGLREERAFCVTESVTEPAEGRAGRWCASSPPLIHCPIILLCGVRPSVGRGSGPLGPRNLVPLQGICVYSTLRVSDYKECVRCSFHSDRDAAEGVMMVGRGV